MPPQYRMYHLRSKKCYSVRKIKQKGQTTKTKKRIFAKCTTKDKATRQIRLLRALAYNPNFKYIKK